MRLQLKIWHRKKRYAIRQNPLLDRTYRIAVGVVGTLMVLAGLVMIPLPIPGPGWVTFFLGLGVLSTEFEWAHRVTSFMRRQLHNARIFAQRVSHRLAVELRTQFDYYRHTMLAHLQAYPHYRFTLLAG
ncbi:MAG: TIGR02611 family protein [Gordonia sp. (in: high G+C Gram-positive bacteria)]